MTDILCWSVLVYNVFNNVVYIKSKDPKFAKDIEFYLFYIIFALTHYNFISCLNLGTDEHVSLEKETCSKAVVPAFQQEKFFVCTVGYCTQSQLFLPLL